MALEPCPSCRRHVRTSERACPFCNTPIADAMASAPRRVMPTGRLGRAALVGLGVAAVGSAQLLEGCGGDDGGNSDSSKVIPPYGLATPPTLDGGQATPRDAGNIDASAIAAYGTPVQPPDAALPQRPDAAVDAGSDAGGDGGPKQPPGPPGPAPLYGGPPTR